MVASVREKYVSAQLAYCGTLVFLTVLLSQPPQVQALSQHILTLTHKSSRTNTHTCTRTLALEGSLCVMSQPNRGDDKRQHVRYMTLPRAGIEHSR